MVGDTEGSFTRMLGVDLDAPASQRYAGIVQDGILIRMVRINHCSSVRTGPIVCAACYQALPLQPRISPSFPV